MDRLLQNYFRLQISSVGSHIVLSLKCYYDQKIIFFFSSNFESVFAFIQRLFSLSVRFEFHAPPLLTFKTDRLDLRGLDLGKSDVNSLTSLKFQRVNKTPVLLINSAA